MAISKLILNGVTQMDVTQDTVTSATLLQNYTATGADGEQVIGAYVASNDFIVTLSYDSQSDMWIPDCTYAELYSAYSGGKNIAWECDNEIDTAEGWFDTTDSWFVYYVYPYIEDEPDGTYIDTLTYRFDANGVTSDGSGGKAYYTDDATALPADVANGKVFYSVNGKGTGSYVAPTPRTDTDVTVSGAIVTIPAGAYASQVQKSVAAGTAGTPSASKGAVSSHSVTVTPSVTNTTGYIAGGTLTGTGVTVSASELVSGTKSITENGTGIDVTNYASVDVSVSGGGSGTVIQDQEGYIVLEDDGEGYGIIPFTATEDGVYNAPSHFSYNPVTVDVLPDVVVEVPVGGAKFIDYDGTVLHTYTTEEFAALSALPANPSHTGLVAQGWNWSLADAQDYLDDYPEATVVIGQNYTTDTGDTRIYITIEEDTPSNRMNFHVVFRSSVANNTTIDWGDGITEVNGSTSTTLANNCYSHTYANTGNYVIKLTVNEGTIAFIGSGTGASDGYSIFGDRTNSASNATRDPANKGRIKKVEIGTNVTQIGQSYFNSCYALESVSIPNSLTSAEIGTYLFYNCYSLKGIVLPYGINTIGANSFYYCRSMSNISIPKTITQINNYAFQYCLKIKEITIPDGVTSLGTGSLGYCDNLNSVILPDGVTTLGNSAFSNSVTLRYVRIPESLVSLGTSVFNTVYALQKIDLPNLTTLGASTFYYCYQLKEFIMPVGVTTVSNTLFYYCYCLRSVKLHSAITSIGASAFYNCYSLISIDIPNSVKTIGSSAFYGCRSLLNITIPSGITSIGTTAFAYCQSLTHIEIPEVVTSVPNELVLGCYSLESIKFNGAITTIGTSGFRDCYSLTTIEMPSNSKITSLGNYAMAGCRSFADFSIFKNVTSFGAYCFQYCYNLKEFKLPDGLASIPNYMFQYCYSLESVDIPDTVTSIGNYAFNGCSALITIELPEDVDTIGERVFQNCYSLVSIVIPENVTSISTYMLNGCYSLSELTIPENVTSIGNYALSGCYGIGEYHIKPTTPPTLGGSGVFNGIPSDCIIYVPYSADHSILAAYQSASNWSTHASKMIEEPAP